MTGHTHVPSPQLRYRTFLWSPKFPPCSFVVSPRHPPQPLANTDTLSVPKVLPSNRTACSLKTFFFPLSVMVLQFMIVFLLFHLSPLCQSESYAFCHSLSLSFFCHSLSVIKLLGDSSLWVSRVSRKQRHWLPLFQVIFTRRLIQRTALENRDWVFP